MMIDCLSIANHAFWIDAERVDYLQISLSRITPEHNMCVNIRILMQVVQCRLDRFPAEIEQISSGLFYRHLKVPHTITASNSHRTGG